MLQLILWIVREPLVYACKWLLSGLSAGPERASRRRQRSLHIRQDGGRVPSLPPYRPPSVGSRFVPDFLCGPPETRAHRTRDYPGGP